MKVAGASLIIVVRKSHQPSALNDSPRPVLAQVVQTVDSAIYIIEWEELDLIFI